MTRMEAEKKASERQRVNTDKGVSYVAEHIGQGDWAVCVAKGSHKTVLEK